MTFAATTAAAQPPQGNVIDGLKEFGKKDSADLILAGVAGIATGPIWGFQKKGFFKYLFYGLNLLAIGWGVWGASQTGGTLYFFGNKLF